MNLLRSLDKPEYLFRPVQILRRFGRELSTPQAFARVALPWGVHIRVRPAESMGGCIWRVGIYELPVSECLWRLLEPGDRAVDAGANIGHMTSLMAVRVGIRGSVAAFEPHPQVYRDLEFNVGSWLKGNAGIAPIHIHRSALADYRGEGRLLIPEGFAGNQGLATLDDGNGSGNADTPSVTVAVERLDGLYDPGQGIGLLKVDVEGRELEVLQGAGALLDRGRIRDILFEEHAPPPTPVTRWLESRGYTVFQLARRLLGPQALPLGTPTRTGVPHEAPNLLATRAPERALKRFEPRGWQVLGGH